MPLNEADTCGRYVVPKLQSAGWDGEPHRINEQATFMVGRIVIADRYGVRRPGKRADYILRYQHDMAIAILEARPTYTSPGQGLHQAEELWAGLTTDESLTGEVADQLLTPGYSHSGKTSRYSQEIAMNLAVQAVLHGRNRILLTMATGIRKRSGGIVTGAERALDTMRWEAFLHDHMASRHTEVAST